ncbi:hypothetical protein PATSB16_09630 [Pandoraea thiooxydans]|nr:hypothetical protein PATSB16_09630 [Pandoraea thiooxydans]
MERTIELTLSCAKRAGAHSAIARLNDSDEISVSVRAGEPTEQTMRRTSHLQLTLYGANRQASVSSSDFSPKAIEALVDRGMKIVDIAAEDPYVGLPDSTDYATEIVDLDLDHPWSLSIQDATDVARRAEDEALSTSPYVLQTEGATLSSHRLRQCLATSDGFLQTQASTSHFISCTPIAIKDGCKEIDRWWSVMVHPEDLMSPQDIGRIAADRAVSRLGARKISTRSCPVLFEPLAAAALVRDFVAATTARPLYTNASYLAGALDSQCFAPHVSVTDDPFVRRGQGSRSYDDIGIALRRRSIVENGFLRGYFLGLYGARRLGLPVSEHGSGPTNLTVSSALTRDEDDFDRMLWHLGTGLVVSGLTGQGVNLMTGDFSRAAHGFWVENGVIQYPVAGITVASNLQRMFKALQAIGRDTLTQQGVTTGSWLVDDMRIGGV